MNNLWNKFIDEVVPSVLGTLLCATIVLLMFGGFIWSIKWVFSLLGVM